jgi:peptidoglycan/LPS O-acetylase OafA/YrhL
MHFIFGIVRWTVGIETALGMTIAIIVPFAMATLSYYVVENPLRKWMVTPFKSFGLGIVIAGVTALLMFSAFSNRVDLALSVTSDRSVWGVGPSILRAVRRAVLGSYCLGHR